MTTTNKLFYIHKRTITAGKIYVEVERARLTHKLSLMKEKEGDISEAATILQELQVETFGSMDRKEKVKKERKKVGFVVRYILLIYYLTNFYNTEYH